MSKDNGGTAFPTVEANWQNENVRSEGMSIRDYMAIHANDRDIDSVMSRHYVPAMNDPGVWSPGTYSITRQQARYIHADAMLAERAK